MIRGVGRRGVRDEDFDESVYCLDCNFTSLHPTTGSEKPNPLSTLSTREARSSRGVGGM